MQSIIDNPRAALTAGVVLAVLVLLAWLIVAGVDGFGFRFSSSASCTCWPP